MVSTYTMPVLYFWDASGLLWFDFLLLFCFEKE